VFRNITDEKEDSGAGGGAGAAATSTAPRSTAATGALAVANTASDRANNSPAAIADLGLQHTAPHRTTLHHTATRFTVCP